MLETVGVLPLLASPGRMTGHHVCWRFVMQPGFRGHGLWLPAFLSWRSFSISAVLTGFPRRFHPLYPKTDIQIGFESE
jgi:hypothetical protein